MNENDTSINTGEKNMNRLNLFFGILAIATFCFGAFYAFGYNLGLAFESCREGMDCQLVAPLARIIFFASPILIIVYFVSLFRVFLKKKLLGFVFIFYVIFLILFSGMNYFVTRGGINSCKIEQKFFNSNQCFHKFAIAFGDETYCMGDNKCTAYVYKQILNTKSDVSFCDKWNTDTHECYRHFASKNNDPSVCLKSDKPEYCLNFLYSQVNNPDICDYYPNKRSEYYLTCLKAFSETRDNTILR